MTSGAANATERDLSCFSVNDNNRQYATPADTCRELTEEFLLSLRGATRAAVTEAMGAEGAKTGSNARYLSNYGQGDGGSGVINFRFNEQGRADQIFGVIDKSMTETGFDFIWNAEHPNGCSDMPGTRLRHCSSDPRGAAQAAETMKRCTIDLAKYKMLRNGMKYEEVRDIVGCDGNEAFEDTLVKMIVYRWDGRDPSAMAAVTFINGQLSSKEQSGLGR